VYGAGRGGVKARVPRTWWTGATENRDTAERGSLASKPPTSRSSSLPGAASDAQKTKHLQHSRNPHHLETPQRPHVCPPWQVCCSMRPPQRSRKLLPASLPGQASRRKPSFHHRPSRRSGPARRSILGHFIMPQDLKRRLPGAGKHWPQ
jgi:hypothetical protein